ncbi:MAG TPA: S41 family peptidase [Steroidobacteraceae bacterium]
MPARALPVRIAVAALALATTLLSACGGGGGGGGGGGSASVCSETARKQWVLNTTREWYLFPETLPASVNLGDYATAETLLDALTSGARALGKDRFFSYLTTKAAENSLLGEGQFNGYGFRTRTDPVNRPMLVDVFSASPAADAGLQRGDEIVAVDQGSGYVPVSQSLASGGSINDLLGPADVGVKRGLRLLRNGSTFDVSLTKRTVTIDPVPDDFGVKVLPLAGTSGVGYVNLRTYISTADQQLRDAFAQMRTAGIQYYIVDLRYNGGGLVSIAQILNDLLGGARSTSDVQYHVVYSANKSNRNSTVNFQPRPQSVQPVRIAFLTTDGTASASEININTLRPYVETAIVGDDTYGKPVGQEAFDLAASCPDRLRLITFKTTNSQNQGDYYTGLASSMTFACAATDTLGQSMSSTSDGLTSEALHWLGTGACTSVISATTPSGAAKPGGDALKHFPRSRHPSAAEFWIPGIG